MSQTTHAFTNDALGEDDATAIADLIKHGKLSPLEVTEAAIARAQKGERNSECDRSAGL
jgi:amidase